MGRIKSSFININTKFFKKFADSLSVAAVVALAFNPLMPLVEFLPAQAASETILANDFENDFDYPWLASSSGWSIIEDNDDANENDKFARVTGDGSETLVLKTNVSGYENIELSYFYRDADVDEFVSTTDRVSVEVSAQNILEQPKFGTTEKVHQAGSASTWTEQVLTLPAKADDKSDLRIRFSSNLDSVADDKFDLDSVTLTGDPIVADKTDPVITELHPVENGNFPGPLGASFGATVTDNETSHDDLEVEFNIVPVVGLGTTTFSKSYTAQKSTTTDRFYYAQTAAQLKQDTLMNDGDKFRVIVTAEDESGNTITEESVNVTLGAAAANPIENLNTNETFETIQEAINDSDTNDGDTIKVLDNDHIEGPQIKVNKSITLTGDGATQTTVLANSDTTASGDSRGWFLVQDSKTFNINDLTLDGNGNKIWQAVRFASGEGSFDNVVFNDIQYFNNGNAGQPYAGTAIAAFGTGPVDVTNSEFTNIGRIGVLYFGSTTSGSSFSNNTYTGKGAGDFLDYALDISNGATVTITNNSVSDNLGQASSDGSTSAAFLVSTYFGSGTEATIENNNISNNTTAIAVGYDENDSSTIEANRNNITNNSNGITNTSENTSIDATANWWGDQSGPSGEAEGSGDSVEAGTSFEPWLCQPYQNGSETSDNGSCDNDPVTTIEVEGLNQNSVGSTFTISGEASDDRSLNRVYLQLVHRGTNTRYGGKTIHLSGTEENWSHTYNATQLDLPEGNYAAHVKVVDDSGNTMTPGWTSDFTLDRTAPEAPTITKPTPRQWFKSTPIETTWTSVFDLLSGADYYQVAYSYDDGHTFGGSDCPEITTIDSKPVSGCRNENGTSRNHVPNNGEQGGVTVWVRVVDNAGNASSWSEPVHYYYDHAAPVTDINVSPVVNGAFTLSGDASDNLALNRVYVQLVSRVDGARCGGTTINLIPEGDSASWSRDYNITTLGCSEGDYAAHVSVVDRAGNTSSAGWTEDFTVIAPEEESENEENETNTDSQEDQLTNGQGGNDQSSQEQQFAFNQGNTAVPTVLSDNTDDTDDEDQNETEVESGDVLQAQDNQDDENTNEDESEESSNFWWWLLLIAVLGGGIYAYARKRNSQA